MAIISNSHPSWIFVAGIKGLIAGVAVPNFWRRLDKSVAGGILRGTGGHSLEGLRFLKHPSIVEKKIEICKQEVHMPPSLLFLDKICTACTSCLQIPPVVTSFLIQGYDNRGLVLHYVFSIL
jgi:hypothetical protein